MRGNKKNNCVTWSQIEIGFFWCFAIVMVPLIVLASFDAGKNIGFDRGYADGYAVREKYDYNKLSETKCSKKVE